MIGLRFSNEKIKQYERLTCWSFDEISMVRSDLLDAIDTVLHQISYSSQAIWRCAIDDWRFISGGSGHQEEEWEILRPHPMQVNFL